MTESKTYKDTVNLPKTNFDMRANAIVREPELQNFWAENQIYEQLSQNNPGDIFVLHDGPPYANGALHIGHALNKILKDIINKYQLLKGRKVRYVPGWDCHGLPIELKVLQDMKPAERQNLTPLQLRQKAKEFALKAVDQQREGFKRYGVWGDWDNPYLTLKPEYEAAQIGVFGQMVLKGYIYRGLKPVHWSPSSKTALAEAELEYPEGHTSRSIYAAFPMVSLSAPLQSSLQKFLPELGVAVWTTTPWTIPANLAVSVNPNLTYAVVEVIPNSETPKTEESESAPSKFKYLIVAADLVERLSSILGCKLEVRANGSGKSLENSTYRHPLFDRESAIAIGGDYVTTESGTGLVHTAPGHGDEDFKVGQRYNLPALSPVDADGNFTEEAGQFAGLNVLGEGNTAVIKALQAAGCLLKEEPYAHKYPYDWRTKKPTIYRATEQWFASVEGFREEALKAIASVRWIPAQGENRITPMVAERSDWCISRQRSWGVPIPVFYDEETGEPLLTEETIAHVQQIIAEKGSDAWWEMSVEELLPAKYRNNGRSYRKGTDTMDVWFDSGSSWAAVAKQRSELHYPVEMYLEGSDQHRGWFQSSLLTSVASNGIAPYKTVLTHGFTLDEEGRKMSKSEGNTIDPLVIIKGGDIEIKSKKGDKARKEKVPAYGADVLRLWVSSVDYSSDVPIGLNILKQLNDVRGKIRNTARFLLGNLHDFDPAKNAVPYEELPELDRYMLHRMTEVFEEITDAFETFQFFRFFQTVQNFCVVDLSNFYLDAAKDRLYISSLDSFRRRSCQTVLAIAVENLAKAIAPVLSHTAEDIWQYIPYPKPHKSVFQAGWVKLDEKWKKPELATVWQQLRQIRGEVNKVMEQARTDKNIGASLEAKVLLYVRDEELRQRLQAFNPKIEPPPAKVDLKLEEEEANIPVQVTIKERKSRRWGEYLEPLYETLSDGINATVKFVGEYQQPLTILSLIVALIGVVYVVNATLTAVNRIPLLEPLFTLLGLIACFRFAKSNLLNAVDREELYDRVQSFTQEVVGKDLPPQKAIEQTEITVPVTAVEEKETIPHLPDGNGVDELRYLFISSGVELLESSAPLEALQYKTVSEALGVGVVQADGEKCDRCWNYSLYVGVSKIHPLLCERCIPAF